MKTHLRDSYFLHLKGRVRDECTLLKTLLLTPGCVVYLQEKMAMISGFIFLCMLQAAIPQGLGPRGPRPVPGRGDNPEPTYPPMDCLSELNKYFPAKY